MTDSHKPISANPGIAHIGAVLPMLRMFRFAYGLCRAVGIGNGKLDKAAAGIDELVSQASIIDLPDRFNRVFASRGWIATESMSVVAAETALARAASGDWEQAESALCDAFDEQTVRVLVLMPVRHMSKRRPQPTQIEVASPVTTRNDLVEEALSLWLERRYLAALPLILIAADGFASEELGYSPFKEGSDLSAFDSIAGHASGLPALIRAVCRTRQATTWNELELPYRHGILHGRDLGYGTRKTVAQAWQLLLALVDWAKAKRDETGRIAKHEARSTQTWRQLAESIETNKRRRVALDNWQPLEFLPPFEEAPTHGSPVETAAKFLEAWKSGRFGPLGLLAAGRANKSAGKLAFEARQTFEGANLLDYRLLAVRQSSPARADAVAWMSVESNGKSFAGEFSFGMLRDRPNGDIAFPDDDDGVWGVMAKIAWDVRHAARDAN